MKAKFETTDTIIEGDVLDVREDDWILIKDDMTNEELWCNPDYTTISKDVILSIMDHDLHLWIKFELYKYFCSFVHTELTEEQRIDVMENLKISAFREALIRIVTRWEERHKDYIKNKNKLMLDYTMRLLAATISGAVKV